MIDLLFVNTLLVGPQATRQESNSCAIDPKVEFNVMPPLSGSVGGHPTLTSMLKGSALIGEA
jgi:hypothetical protein